VETRPAPERVEALSHLWSRFVDHEFGTYSPLYAAIGRGVAADDELLGLVLEAPDPAHQPNVLLAAVHYLLLGGLDHPLAELYRRRAAGVEPAGVEPAGVGPTGAEPTGADPAPLFRDLCLSHRAEVLELLATRRTQTNECGRCAVLAPGLAAAAERIGQPVALVDAGASAGLNLLVDRYLLDYGTHGSVGPADSPVRISCSVRSESLPLPALPPIGPRLGIDRSPIDLTDPDDVRWLLACVWPDTGRLERTAAAVELARLHPTVVRTGDMVADLPAVLDEVGTGPVVVVTSWSFSYLSPGQRQGLTAVLADAGRRRPVAWVSMDTVGVVEQLTEPLAALGTTWGARSGTGDTTPSVLGLVVYDGVDSRAEALALVHPHGAWISWLAGP
jgi:hypothetical protein